MSTHVKTDMDIKENNGFLRLYINSLPCNSDNSKASLGPIAQSVASPTADPGVVSLIPAQTHTFVEIDIILFILLLPLIQEGLLSFTSKRMCTKYRLTA